MSVAYAIVGSPTTGGGQITTGDSLFIIDGTPIACVGDRATCPLHQSDVIIVTGDPACIINGKAAARVGDSLSCGCKILPKQVRVVGDNFPSKSPVASPAPSSSHLNSNFNSNSGTDEQQLHGLKIQFKDELSKQPVPYLYYKLKKPDGHFVEGLTDEQGYTEEIQGGYEAEEIEIINLDLDKPYTQE
ncbi:PAAR domain-containing protein [Alkanindiges sp. WGS2144]|uniref:PAAR domain-containing protein n=1 Tax=Alkanindiges sp. WGS2144 TaxID=3366808 RepID=UPI0037508C53